MMVSFSKTGLKGKIYEIRCIPKTSWIEMGTRSSFPLNWILWKYKIDSLWYNIILDIKYFVYLSNVPNPEESPYNWYEMTVEVKIILKTSINTNVLAIYNTNPLNSTQLIKLHPTMWNARIT